MRYGEIIEYQEPGAGTFTHDGKDYDLNQALAVTADRPVYNLPLKSMKWILRYDDADPERLARADVEAPILVTIWEDKLTVIDGLHRLAKADVQNLEHLPAQMIAACRLPEFEVGKPQKQKCDDENYELYYEMTDHDTRLWSFMPSGEKLGDPILFEPVLGDDVF